MREAGIGLRFRDGGSVNRNRAVAQEQLQERTAKVQQHTFGGRITLKMTDQHRLDRLLILSDNRFEQAALVAEPGIKGFLRCRCALGDLEHARVAISSLRKNLDSDIHNLVSTPFA